MNKESPQYSFNFDTPEAPAPKSRPGESSKRLKSGADKLSPEERERYEKFLQEALDEINDPNNKRYEMLRMSAEEEKLATAKLKAWDKFKGNPGFEYHGRNSD